MTQHTNPIARPTTQALSRLPMFGPPPLLQGEDGTAYDDLLACVSGNLKPADIFEEIWMREMVDLLWESMRLRRHQSRFLDAALPKVLEEVIRPLLDDQPTAAAGGTSWTSQINAAHKALTEQHDLVRRWLQGDPEAIKRIDELLTSVKLSIDHVAAQVAVRELETVERFNRLIANQEWRRNALLREIERRRASFAQKLRGVTDKIEDAEFKTVETQPIAAEPVAAKPVEANTAKSIDAVVDAEPVKPNPAETKPIEVKSAEAKPIKFTPIEANPHEDGIDKDGMLEDCTSDDASFEVVTKIVEINATNIGLYLDKVRAS